MRILFAALAFGLAGCSLQVPVYAPSYDNVQALGGSAAAKVAVSDFSAAKDAESVSARGTRLVPPTTSFAVYIKGALEAELEKAGLLAPMSDTSITADIQENEVDAFGVNTGEASVRVEFRVVRGGQTVFRKTVSAVHSWESSFIGAIAIPRAQASYPKLIEKLLANLYAEPDFKKVLEGKA